MAEKKQKSRGMGCTFKRGRFWYGQYFIDGKRFRFNTHATEREEAEAIVAMTVGRIRDDATASMVDTWGANRTYTGLISELIVCADLTGRGYEVFKALNHYASVDLIAMRGPEMLRVEVKTGGRDGHVSAKRQRQRGQFDVLAIVIKGKTIIYHPDLKQKSSIKPHFEPNEQSDDGLGPSLEIQ